MTLREKIEKAFAHRDIPREVVEMEGRLQVDSDVEDGLWFKGKVWRDLTAEDWRAHYCGLSYFNEEAFAYYLQSLLVLTLRDPKNYPDLAVDSFLWELDCSPGGENLSPLSYRYLALTNEEFGALKEWIVWASENIRDVFYGAAVGGPGDGFGRVFDSIGLLQRESALRRGDDSQL